MTLYELMREYSQFNKQAPVEDSPTPELGHSLSLFHASLVESGLSYEGTREKPKLIASATEIDTSHLSHFIVAFLPFNSVTEKSEFNHVLFDLYSFFRWLDLGNTPHGLGKYDVNKLIKDLCSMQERCLKLSHMLDDESGRVLDNPPEIMQTVTDLFFVEKIEEEHLYLKGTHMEEVICLKLPPHIMPLVQLQDNLDLVLGDASDSWVLLEAGQVYPTYQEIPDKG